MEKIQVIQPTKLLTPYIKQYWFLRIDDVKQEGIFNVLSGRLCSTCFFIKEQNYFFFHKGTQPHYK